MRQVIKKSYIFDGTNNYNSTVMKIYNNTLLLIYFISSLILIGLTSHSQTTISLYGLTIDTISFDQLTIECTTNLLGRPSAIDKNDSPHLKDIIGPTIYYHDLGLSFMFNPKSKDTEQKLKSFTMYFAQTWDDKYGMYFDQYSGNIIPKINGSMKLSDVLILFQDYNTTIETAQQRKDSIEKNVGKEYATNINHDVMSFNLMNAKVNLMFEELTKFLDRGGLIIYEKK